MLSHLQNTLHPSYFCNFEFCSKWTDYALKIFRYLAWVSVLRKFRRFLYKHRRICESPYKENLDFDPSASLMVKQRPDSPVLISLPLSFHYTNIRIKQIYAWQCDSANLSTLNTSGNAMHAMFGSQKQDHVVGKHWARVNGQLQT